MSCNEGIIRYPMRSNKEKPLFEYLVKTSMEFEYWLFDEFDDALNCAKKIHRKTDDIVLIYDTHFNTNTRQWYAKQSFNIMYDGKVRYDKHGEVQLHLEFYINAGEWMNPRQDWVKTIRDIWNREDEKSVKVTGVQSSAIHKCTTEVENSELTELERFEKMVLLIAEKTGSENNELDDEIEKFEDVINKSKLGSAYFGIAGSDWDRIEVLGQKRIPYGYQKDGVKFYAEYYDGNQAPFAVCKWKDDFEKLEELLKNTSPILWKLYKNVLSEK